jgi:hypothetical protein
VLDRARPPCLLAIVCSIKPTQKMKLYSLHRASSHPRLFCFFGPNEFLQPNLSILRIVLSKCDVIVSTMSQVSLVTVWKTADRCGCKFERPRFPKVALGLPQVPQRPQRLSGPLLEGTVCPSHQHVRRRFTFFFLSFCSLDLVMRSRM